MKNEKILLYVLALVQFTNIMDFMIMMPLNPILSKLFLLSPKQFGILVSSYTLSAAISGFSSAFFADKFDRRLVLLTMYAGFTLGTFACAAATTYELLLLARCFTGVFGGVLGATVMAIIGDAIPQERRGAAMGTVMAAFAAASVFGVPFGLFLATKLTWHAPFILLGAIGVFTTFAIFFFIPSFQTHIASKKEQTNPLQVLANIAADSNQITALAFSFTVFFGMFTVIPFLSDYMVSNVGFEQEQLPFIYFTGGLCTIFTSPLVGKAADKYGKLQVFLLFAFLTLIPIIVITNLPKMSIYVVLCITTVFFILSNGRAVPAVTMISGAVPPSNRGGFMSINSAVQSAASASAAYIAGLIVTKENGMIANYNVVGYVSVVVAFLAIFIATRVKQVQ
jgi:DHA1 family inner membrane transport protein